MDTHHADEERISRMRREGKLTPAEAERLLESLRAQQARDATLASAKNVDDEGLFHVVHRYLDTHCGEGTHERLVSEVERLMIERTLAATGGNREQAAKMLDIGTRTLYRKIKEYGL